MEQQRRSNPVESAHPVSKTPVSETPAPAESPPVVATATPATATSTALPRATDPDGRGPGEPIFTADHLVRSGLPFSFVVQLGDLGSLDDISRLMQLSTALQPWCDVLPKNDSLIVGLRADRLAGVLGATVHGPRDPLPTEGSAIWIGDPNDAATTEYLEQVRGSRRLHVVDPSTTTLAALEPGTIVSWSDETVGFDALLFALERGLHLGFDISGPAARRATAVEIAIAIRARLPLCAS